MEFRPLGSSGLKVSAIGLGCNNFGGRADFAASQAVIHKAIDLGITLFDTANIYANGKSEEFLGEILGPRRKDVVLLTKFGMAKLGDAAPSASRQNMMQSFETSLRRLRTDHIDIFMLHYPDPATPIEETLRAFEDLIRQGKVRAIANSNFAPSQISEADRVAKAKKLTPFCAAENEYSLLSRDAEADLIPALQELGLGLLPYFPLANGMLTGKYRRGAELPAGSRLAGHARWAAQTLTDTNWDRLEKLESFCAARGRTLLQLAFAWLKAKPVVSSIIAGATKPEQVEANVAAAAITLSPEEVAELDALTSNEPPPPGLLSKLWSRARS